MNILNIKKLSVFAVLFAVMLACFTVTALEDNAADTNADSADMSELVGFVVLPHAKLEGERYVMSTVHENISVLGASDPLFTLHVNGEPVTVTASGYFALFLPLEVGDNVYIFSNGDVELELVIARTVPEPSDLTPAVVEPFDEVLYGRAIHQNISRFYDKDDDGKPGTPLPRGFVFQIMAQHGDTYILADGSYVFKSNVELIDAAEYEAVIAATAQLPLPELSSDSRTRPFPRTLSDAVVILDAGHGGTDPGALGPPGDRGLMEKDLNLYVARAAREYLRRRGVTAELMRKGDWTLPAVERMDSFGEGEYDLLVSIHANSMPMHHDFTSATGPLMFYSLPHSETAANIILQRVAEMTGHDFEPARLRNFAMARYTFAPSMLFEMGFVCNPYEYERLQDLAYLDLIAESLAEGILDYLLTVVEEKPEGYEEPAEVRENQDEQEEEVEPLNPFGTWDVQQPEPLRNDMSFPEKLLFALCLVFAAAFFGTIIIQSRISRK